MEKNREKNKERGRGRRGRRNGYDKSGRYSGIVKRMFVRWMKGCRLAQRREWRICLLQCDTVMVI